MYFNFIFFYLFGQIDKTPEKKRVKDQVVSL
jgi:hypothetical protein